MKPCLAYLHFILAARGWCAAGAISSDLEDHAPIAQDVLIQTETEPDVTREYHEVELLQTAIQLHHLDSEGPAVQQQAESQAELPSPLPLHLQQTKSQAHREIASDGGQGMEGLDSKSWKVKSSSFPDLASVASCIRKVSATLNHSTCDYTGCGTRLDLSSATANIHQMVSYIALASDYSVKTICETGFSTGVSSALWLCTNPYATLYSFDLEFAPENLLAIKSKFGDRLVPIEGDTLQTLTEFAAQDQPPPCDLMIMDGGHTGQVPRSDLTNFAKIANKSTDRKHSLIVDEIFFDILDNEIFDRRMIPDEDEDIENHMTRAMLGAWNAGMFDDDHSECYSYENPRSKFPLTKAGMREMSSTYPVGGWCQLIFST